MHVGANCCCVVDAKVVLALMCVCVCHRVLYCFIFGIWRDLFGFKVCDGIVGVVLPLVMLGVLVFVSGWVSLR